MNLAIDVMGGDNAPLAALSGCEAALKLLPEDAELTLYGDKTALDDAVAAGRFDVTRVSVVYTTETIGCDEQPTLAIRKKKDSSMVRALEDVAAGRADCIVSAGSTGALLTGATLIIRRQKGVKRPALAVALPTLTGCVLLLDSGANTDCKPEYLAQFALMGSTYMARVFGIHEPRVGLLNNGTEEEKGNELTKAAHQLLKSAPVHFAGNCEARDVLSGEFDVVVCDGFDGNVVLKTIEGTASMLMKKLKAELTAGALVKAGAFLARPAFASLKKSLDYSEYGGAPLIGVAGGVIKAHGSSDAKAFCSAILQAHKLTAGNVVALVGEAVASFTQED